MCAIPETTTSPKLLDDEKNDVPCFQSLLMVFVSAVFCAFFLTSRMAKKLVFVYLQRRSFFGINARLGLLCVMCVLFLDFPIYLNILMFLEEACHISFRAKSKPEENGRMGKSHLNETI
jgi:hypothetical protein